MELRIHWPIRTLSIPRHDLKLKKALKRHPLDLPVTAQAGILAFPVIFVPKVLVSSDSWTGIWNVTVMLNVIYVHSAGRVSMIRLTWNGTLAHIQVNSKFQVFSKFYSLVFFLHSKRRSPLAGYSWSEIRLQLSVHHTLPCIFLILWSNQRLPSLKEQNFNLGILRCQ